MPENNYAGTGRSLSQLESTAKFTRKAWVVESLASLEQELRELQECIREARGLLFQWAEEDGASIILGSENEVVVSNSSGSYEWEYNLEKLSELQAYVEPNTLDRALVPVPATVKVAKVELNKLKKLGGPILAIIDAGCIKVETGGGRKLEVRRRTL